MRETSKGDRLQIGRLKGHRGWFRGTPSTAFAYRTTGRAVIGGCEESFFAKSDRLVHIPTLPRPFPSRDYPLTPFLSSISLSPCARDPERRGFTLPGRQMSGCRSRATTIVWSCSGRAASARVPSCCVSWKDPSASPTYQPSRILTDRWVSIGQGAGVVSIPPKNARSYNLHIYHNRRRFSLW